MQYAILLWQLLEWVNVQQLTWLELQALHINRKASSKFWILSLVTYAGFGMMRTNNWSRFFYADERQADGSPTIPVGGNAAAQMYTELAEAKEQGPWNYTFMEGKGYTEFK